MKRTKTIIAILIAALVISPSYAAAETITSYNQELDFAAIGAADEVQNAWDANSQTNFDTWNPVPQGVWFGGYPVESLLRLNDVPDTNFSIAMAGVARFGSDIIMSGAARTVVRLPVFTGDDYWTAARLNVYKISEGSNWTFSKIIQSDDYAGADLNNMKINFSAGSHELVFWSESYDPTDQSPTDDDDHYTRDNRTYVFVDAPIKPNQYYLFVTYVWYDADKYADIYYQPDPIDATGEWNRSTVAIYNEIAPDTHNLNVHNLNISLGYSFDFQNGFGNSAYGLNIWCESGDTIEFFSYINLSNVADTDYLTIMVPFKSSISNVSWDVLIQVMDVNAGPPAWGAIDLHRWNGQEFNDFILLSLTTTWLAEKTAHSLTNPFEWFKIILYVNNQTRIRLPLWDETPPTGTNATINTSWNHGWFEPIWDSDTEFSYNLGQWVQHESAGHTQHYNYHWVVQHALQFNDYYWQKHTPPAKEMDNPDPVEDMTFLQKILWARGYIWFSMGSAILPVNLPVGSTFRAIGLAAQVYAMYGDFPQWTGRIWDGLVWVRDQLAGFGQWLWRAAQKVVGGLEYFIDLVSFLLGIIILIMAFAALYTMVTLTLKGAMAFRKAIIGDLEGAAAHLNAGAEQSTKALAAFRPRGKLK